MADKPDKPDDEMRERPSRGVKVRSTSRAAAPVVSLRPSVGSLEFVESPSAGVALFLGELAHFHASVGAFARLVVGFVGFVRHRLLSSDLGSTRPAVRKGDRIDPPAREPRGHVREPMCDHTAAARGLEQQRGLGGRHRGGHEGRRGGRRGSNGGGALRPWSTVRKMTRIRTVCQPHVLQDRHNLRRAPVPTTIEIRTVGTAPIVFDRCGAPRPGTSRWRRCRRSREPTHNHTAALKGLERWTLRRGEAAASASRRPARPSTSSRRGPVAGAGREVWGTSAGRAADFPPWGGIARWHSEHRGPADRHAHAAAVEALDEGMPTPATFESLHCGMKKCLCCSGC